MAVKEEFVLGLCGGLLLLGAIFLILGSIFRALRKIDRMNIAANIAPARGRVRTKNQSHSGRRTEVILGFRARPSSGATCMKIGDFTMDHPIEHRTVGDAPAVLRASTYFWLASALVSGVIPAIVMVAQPPDPILFAVGMGFVLLLTALQCWAAFRLRRGEHWARFVLSIVTILSLGGAFSAAPTPLVIIGLVLTLAGAVLMWTPASIAFLRRNSAAG
ncbi:hypothetical protein WMO79_04025 [Micrococcaceae bacterium Sec7.4]